MPALERSARLCKVLRTLPAWPPFGCHHKGLTPPALASPATQLSEGVFQKRVFKMAVFRCEVKTLKRAAGRSAVAAAAYRAADRLRDEQANEGAGKVHDYRRRAPGVAYRETMAPKGAPEWATQRGKLWNEAERAENRKNSTTAREAITSLPHELDDVQRIELVRGFASRLIGRYGVAVDFAIHRPDRKGDQRNHHAHLLFTTRRMGREGLAEKTRELDDRTTGPLEIQAIREMWEVEQNLALERAGHPERVSRLSNAAQGIEREPQPKLGSAAAALMRQGQPTRLGARWKEVADRNAMQANAARVMKMRQAETAGKVSPMRANMAAQAARKRAPEVEAEKQAALKRALDAAAQQKAREHGPAKVADALMRDTSEAQRGQQEAEQAKKDEARKLDEQRAREAEVSAARAWERQRQAELRKQRTARDAQQVNDPGRLRKPPEPSE